MTAIFTILLIFACNDSYGCRTVQLPMPNVSVTKCLATAPMSVADWASQLPEDVRVHEWRCAFTELTFAEMAK
jgi:hypothetical protein